jgi:hypothetical protein
MPGFSGIPNFGNKSDETAENRMFLAMRTLVVTRTVERECKKAVVTSTSCEYRKRYVPCDPNK